MATITRTTNEWINQANDKNKEYLFLVQNSKRAETLSEIEIKKIDIRNLSPANQQSFAF